ncbi:MAG: ATP-binding protein [Solibacillus sp.]
METTQSTVKRYRQFGFILLVALLTTCFGEIKILPFDDAPFRFGLGSIVFFLALLIQPLPILLTGFVTGITVVAFRIAIDLSVTTHSFYSSFIEHGPALIFYIIFAIGLRMIDLQKIKTHPFLLGLYGMIFEGLANIFEQLFTSLFVTQDWLSIEGYVLFFAVGCLRSFFVVGIYSTITFSEQKKQMHNLLSLHTDLYMEAMYLQKSMEQTEQLTADSFQLYKTLKSVDRKLSYEALRISQEMHEVKKDHERIYSGLTKLFTTERNYHFLLTELLDYVIAANENYAHFLKKNIQFDLTSTYDFTVAEPYKLLIILNNVVANAVEAIEQSGHITINVRLTALHVQFIIENDGPRIPSEILPILFDAGYTSKFSKTGAPSTGIGLSHTLTIIQQLHGDISVTSEEKTQFTMNIPLHTLRK